MDITSWNDYSTEENINPFLLNILNEEQIDNPPKKVKLAGRSNAPKKAASSPKKTTTKKNTSPPQKKSAKKDTKKPKNKPKVATKGKEHVKLLKSSISQVGVSGKIIKNKPYKKFVLDIPEATLLRLIKEQKK